MINAKKLFKKIMYHISKNYAIKLLIMMKMNISMACFHMASVVSTVVGAHVRERLFVRYVILGGLKDSISHFDIWLKIYT